MIGWLVGVAIGFAATFVLAAALDRLGMPPWAAPVVMAFGALVWWYFSTLYEQKTSKRRSNTR